jgi:oligoribonuclease NrnB/cAMP/cGMP phosphodiesterase (DHH superfamily)
VLRYFIPSVKNKQIHACGYHNVDAVVRKVLDTTPEMVLITDLSVKEETANYIEKNYPQRVELYDHHKTAQQLLAQYSWAHIDTERSGTQIIFDIFAQRYPQVNINPGLAKLVYNINDYDLWHHHSQDSKKLNDLLFMLGKDHFVKLMIERIADNQPLISSLDQMYLEGLEQQKVLYFSERVKRCAVIGNRLVLVASRHISELSQYIRDLSPSPPEWQDVDYIDILNFEYGSHALRSYQSDFDVSAVALQKGGGGHPQAAGYPMEISETMESWLARY